MTKSKYAFRLEKSEHAKLNASSSERWLTCPGSVQLSADLPNHASKFAAEGTAAHHIAAICQNERRLAHEWVGQEAMVEGYRIELTEELCDAVQEFLDYAIADTQPGDVVLVEQSFTAAMKKLDPELGGSTDRIRWRPSTRLLTVYDYKHGAGVPVDVDDNKQLKYYALGALLANPQWNAEDVELCIAQPRCDHEQGRIRKWSMKAFDLLEFAAELMMGAAKTREFGADLVPSKKACKFCPALRANKCPAAERETHALIEASFDVVPPETYSATQIAEFLEKAPLVEARISAIREFAYKQALQGEHFPGWKIVDKRATRKWKAEAPVASTLQNVPGAFTFPELKSPAQIEKLLGKKKFAEQFTDHIEKISSGTTLVQVHDPRPPAQVALLEHFEDVSSNE
jgi:hypothetical protein